MRSAVAESDPPQQFLFFPQGIGKIGVWRNRPTWFASEPLARKRVHTKSHIVCHWNYSGYSRRCEAPSIERFSCLGPSGTGPIVTASNVRYWAVSLRTE